MSMRVFDNDRNTYRLSDLRLDEGLEEVGSGNFGSIYKGTIGKSASQLFQANSREIWVLGIYHGTLLAVHPRNRSHIPAIAANEEDTRTQVAVKLIKTVEEEEHEPILEASNVRFLWGHRNFVKIYGVTRSRDLEQKYFDMGLNNKICLCLVMDFVRGCNLNDFLKLRGKKLADSDEEVAKMRMLWESNEVLWWIEKLKLFREIVIALIVCHREKVYHGDLKGPNIVLDRSLIPKMVDFGLSFRRGDFNYLNKREVLGGSLFWSAPEATSPVHAIDEVDLSDPYSADVYSLGMVLAEMMLDGDIPDDFAGEESVLLEKYNDEWQTESLDGVICKYDFNTNLKGVLEDLKELVSRCCKCERTERISLQDCLQKVNDIYSDLCNQDSVLIREIDKNLTETMVFKEMVSRFKDRFPDVPDCMIWSPSWNMVMDAEENLLVHYFCKLDYAEGVKYIVEKSTTWGFQSERDLPYLSLLCVREESLQTLKYLAESWPDMMKRQLLLLHKGCFCNNPEVFRFLLLNVGIYFDTFEMVTYKEFETRRLNKPIITLAALGKTQLVQLILDKCGVGPDYINTCSASRGTTALSAALDGGDNAETVTFLLERGGTLYPATSGNELHDTVFCLASERGHLKVCVELLELRCNSFHAGVDLPENPDSSNVLDMKSCAIDAQEHLKTLKDHIQKHQALDNPTVSPLKTACRKGNDEVLRSVLWLMLVPQSKTRTCKNGRLASKLVTYTAFYKNPAMVDLVYMFTHGTGQFKDYKVVRPNFQMRAMYSERQKAREQEEISYARKILSDFTTGACKEAITLHFQIDYPLALAKECCEKGYLGILQFLEDHCRILDLSRTSRRGESLLHGNRWESLLHTAALYGHVNVAKFLLDKGFSANSLARECLMADFSPLQEACGSGFSRHRKEMVDLLLAAGADPNHKDSNNRTAMHMLNAENEDGRDVVRLLMKAGFTFDPRAHHRESEPITNYRSRIPGLLIPKPIREFALGSNSYDRVAESYAQKILHDFESGACDEVISIHFQIGYPLVLARQCCEKGYLGVLQFLEDSCRLDLSELRRRGEQPSSTRYDSLLHTAAYFGQVDVAKFLIVERGFGVNKVVNPGRWNSPLQDAIVTERSRGKNKKAMVKLLLERGADPNYKNFFGYTAMDQVDTPPYEETRGIIRLLLEAGYESGNKDRWGEDCLDLVTKLGKKYYY